MKIYNTQAEVDKDIVDNVVTVVGDVTFTFDLKLEASLVVKEGNIKALNIKALNIKAWDIKAWDIEAKNIKAKNIDAWDIKAGDISFWAFALTLNSFTCKSITGRRKNAKYFCLDNEVHFTKFVKP